MAKPRIPLPKQVEKVHRAETDYSRRREKKVSLDEYGHEWNVGCPNCGHFVAIQKGEPVICPKCFSTDIDTSRKEV